MKSSNLIWINIALSVLFIIAQVTFLQWLGFNLYISAIDSSVSWALIILISNSTGNILRYYRPGKNKFFNVFIWDLAVSGVWLFIIHLILSYLISDAVYTTFLAKSLPVRFFISFLVTGWFAMLSWTIYSNEEQQKNEKRKAEAEKLAKDAELFKLRKQLHPHFLFNSLNSISSLTVSRPEEARRMVQQLADFLRGTLKNEEELQVTLEEELRLLHLYLDIEKVRFGHRLETLIEFTPQPPKGGAIIAHIPQLILQPIVENAIKFGLYDTTEKVLIKIAAKKENEILIVTVQNPFDPSTSSSNKGTGFGLNSISRRLYLLYGRHDLLETTTKENLFITTIKIPQHA